MLIILIYFGIGFGLAKLIKRRDTTGVILFTVVVLIVLIINITLITPQKAGVWTGGFLMGVISQWKSSTKDKGT